MGLFGHFFSPLSFLVSFSLSLGDGPLMRQQRQFHYLIQPKMGVVGWCDGPGITSSAGASYYLDDSRARAYCACSRCGWGCLDIFTVFYPFSPLYPSLWETARYRLKYCLKGLLSPKQPTNQIHKPRIYHYNTAMHISFYQNVTITQLCI